MLSFLVRMILIVSVLPGSTFPQAPPAPETSPTGTVQEFWKCETGGKLPTTEGWYRSSRFFISLSPLSTPSAKVLHVIRNGRVDVVEELARTENWAEVSVTTDEVGQIDSRLHFEPAQRHGPHGVLLLKGPVLLFHVVRTEKHWDLNADGSRGKEQIGPPEWLIDCAQSELWIDLDVAIRYVNEMRAKSTDPHVSKNADLTLAKLKKLQ